MTDPSAPAHASVRVAIADDNEDLRLILAELLDASPGLQCVARISCQQDLLASLAQTRPDVLVLDLLFAGLSSLPLLPQLRTAAPGTRIVVHSGYDIAQLTAAVLAAGAVAVIPKGSDPDELIAAIRRAARE